MLMDVVFRFLDTHGFCLSIYGSCVVLFCPFLSYLIVTITNMCPAIGTPSIIIYVHSIHVKVWTDIKNSFKLIYE